MFGMFRYIRAFMKYHLMIACLCSLLIGLSSLTARSAANSQPESRQSFQQSEDDRTLAPGAPVEREISGGQPHVWRISLSAGDYLRLSATRKTGKLAASLFAPESAGTDRTDGINLEGERKPLLSTIDQNVILEHDSNSRLKTTFSLIAESSGTYSLEISILNKDLAQAHYEVIIEALRPAMPNDRLRVAAEKAELEGDLVIDGDATLEGRMLKIARYEASLALWRELGDRKSELRLLRMIGRLYQPLGELQTTLRYYGQAIQIARDLGDRYQEANLKLSFGHIQRSLGDTQKALDAYQQAREIFAGLSARLGEAGAIESIGGIYLSLGEARQAIDCYEKALPTYISVGEPFGQSNVLNSLGLAHSRLGETQEAIGLYTRALENARKRGLTALEASTLGNLGSAHLALGDKHKGAEYFTQELTLCRRMGARVCMASALNSLGNVSFLSGEKERSLDYLSESLKLFRS